MKRRLTFLGGTSAKVWEAETKGESLTIRFGALGQDPRGKTKTLSSADKAHAELDKLAEKKLAEGYIEEGAFDDRVERPRVRWNEHTQTLVHPRRTSNLPAPTVDVDEAWASLAKAFAPLREKVRRDIVHDNTENQARTRAVLESFASKKPQPPTADAETESVRAHLLSIHDFPWAATDVIGETLVDFWCAAYGVELAVAAMVETFRRARAFPFDAVVTLPKDRFATTPLVHSDMRPWQVLRRHLASCPKADYDRARVIADRANRKGVGHERMSTALAYITAFVFPDEDAWARTMLARGPFMALVSCVTDVETVERVMDAAWSRGQGYASPLDYVYDVLDGLGPSAFEPLRHLFDSTRAAKRPIADQRTVAIALASIESASAATWFSKMRGDEIVGPIAVAHAALAPDLTR